MFTDGRTDGRTDDGRMPGPAISPEPFGRGINICSYSILPKGLQNEFEPAVVNEPSVFEPLKVYYVWQKYFFSLTTVLYDCLYEYILSEFHIFLRNFLYFVTTNIFSGSCYADEYECDNGRCIDDLYTCNDYNSCGDNSDCEVKLTGNE